MKILQLIRAQFCRFCFPNFATGAGCGDFDGHDFARITKSKIANACSPDDIIAAYIVRDIAENYQDWTISGDIAKPPLIVNLRRRGVLGLYTSGSYDQEKPFSLKRGEIEISGQWQVKYKEKKTFAESNYAGETYSAGVLKAFVINGVDFELAAGERLLKEVAALVEVHRKATTVAYEAKKKMRDAEKKWNLAEALLGMKRDENGALRPMNFGEKMASRKAKPLPSKPGRM